MRKIILLAAIFTSFSFDLTEGMRRFDLSTLESRNLAQKELSAEIKGLESRIQTIADNVSSGLRNDIETGLQDLRNKFYELMGTIVQNDQSQIDNLTGVYDSARENLEGKLREAERENAELKRRVELRANVRKVFNDNHISIERMEKVYSCNNAATLSYVREAGPKLCPFVKWLNNGNAGVRRIATQQDYDEVNKYLKAIVISARPISAAEVYYAMVTAMFEGGQAEAMAIMMKDATHREQVERARSAVFPANSFNRLVDQFNLFVDIAQ